MVMLTQRLVNASNAEVPRSPRAGCLTVNRTIAFNYYPDVLDVNLTMRVSVIERMTLSSVFCFPPKATSKHRISILRRTAIHGSLELTVIYPPYNQYASRPCDVGWTIDTDEFPACEYSLCFLDRTTKPILHYACTRHGLHARRPRGTLDQVRQQRRWIKARGFKMDHVCGQNGLRCKGDFVDVNDDDALESGRRDPLQGDQL